MAKKNRALRGDNFTKGEMWWYYALVYGLIWVAVAYNLTWGILSIMDKPLIYLFNNIDNQKLNATLEVLKMDTSLEDVNVRNMRQINAIFGSIGIVIALYGAFCAYLMLKFKKHAVGFLNGMYGLNMAINGVILPILYQVNIAEVNTLAALKAAGALVDAPSTLINFLLGWCVNLATLVFTLKFFGDKTRLFKNKWFGEQD